MNNPLKLHLGCGTKHLDGCINIDSIEACKPDVLHDLSQPLPYEDLSVDEILAEDLLEHFDKYQRYLVFFEWARVMTLDAKITLQVPDFKKLLRRYFKFGFNNFVDSVFGENLWQSQHYLGYYGNHKFAYSKDSLAAFVRTFGLEPESLETVGLNINMIARKKRHVTFDEIQDIMIPSVANRGGDGKDAVSVGYAKKQIDVFQGNNTNKF